MEPLINIYGEVQSLQKSTIEPGGLCTLSFGKIEDVADWPVVNPATGIMETAVAMKPGTNIYICEAAEKGKTFSFEEKEDDGGPYLDVQINGRLGGANTANIMSLIAGSYSQFFVIAKDRQGFYHFVGDPDSGADLKWKYDTADATGSRMVDLQWSWSCPAKSMLYQSTLFQITIGGVRITAGYLKLLLNFKVGQAGAPMADGDQVLTDAAFAGKKLLVLASGAPLDWEDGSNSIEWTDPITGATQRHYEKLLASDTLTIVGGVAEGELIQIYEIN